MGAKRVWTCVSFAVLALTSGHSALADEAGCLVIGAWDEARGEPAPVIEAVVSTIVNRAHVRGISVCDAVMDPSSLSGVAPAMHELFSEAAKPHSGSGTPQPRNDKDRAQLAAVLAAAERAVAGTLPDRTHGATHFYSPAGLRELGLPDRPGWAAAMEQTASVGPFVFLREKTPPVTDAALKAPPTPQAPAAPIVADTPVRTVALVPVPAAPQPEDAAKPKLSPADPIFALAPPPPASPPAPIAIAEMPKTRLAGRGPDSSQLPSVAYMEVVEPDPAPIALPAMRTAELAARPVGAIAASIPQAPQLALAAPQPVERPASGEVAEWVPPPSPYDPPAAPQVVRSAAQVTRPSIAPSSIVPLSAAQLSAPLKAVRAAEIAAPPAAPALHARPVVPVTIRAPTVKQGLTKAELASLKPVTVMPLNVQPARAMPVAVPIVTKPVEMATVVLDPPRYLTLPSEVPRFQVAEAPAAAPQPRAQEDGAQFQAQVADNSQYQQPAATDQPQQATDAPPTPLYDAPGYDAPGYDAPGPRPSRIHDTPAAQPSQQDDTVETVTEEETTEAPTDPQPAYQPPVYNPPAYSAPSYPTRTYSAQAYPSQPYQQAPRYAPPGYSGPQWSYWNQQPTYAPPRAPAQSYWPYYRPAALSAACPAGNRRVIWVQVQGAWGQPKMARRRVCME